jgi:hypothetical protein
LQEHAAFAVNDGERGDGSAAFDDGLRELARRLRLAHGALGRLVGRGDDRGLDGGRGLERDALGLVA